MLKLSQILSALLVTASLLTAPSLLAAPVDISADQISRTADGVVIAKGHVIIKRDGETLRADEVIYRGEKQLMEAIGHVVIESEQATIHAENALMQTNSKTGNLTKATIIMPGGERLVAEKVRRIDDQRLEAEKLTYSACPIDEESWRIAASKALVDQEDGTLTTEHGRFQLWGIPVLYSPWWQHPLRRKSGLLMPKIASGKRRGTEVALPLYLALDPSWDATATPHWMSARGLMGDLELRHISEAGYERLRGSFINDSDIKKDRYHYSGDIHWDMPAGISFDARGDYVSDKDYLADFNTSNDISSNYLTSHATLSQGFNSDSFSGNWLLQSRHQQNLLAANNKSTLQILPRAESRLQWKLSPNLLLHFDQQSTRFDRKVGVKGWRVDLHPYVELPWELDGGGLSANLQFGSHHTRYWLQQSNLTNIKPIRSTFETNLEVRGDFERISSSGKWRHVISPIFRYDYIDAPDQDTLPNFDSRFGRLAWNSLLSGNRFAGYDRIERTNRFSAALESRWQHKGNETEAARDILILRAGSSYDLHRQSIDPALQTAAARPFDNLLAEAIWSPTAGLSLSTSGQYNHADRYWATGQALAVYRHSTGNYIRLGYSYRDARYSSRSQLISGTGKLRIADRWHATGTVQYDTVLKLTQQTSIELKYQHPCWTMGIEGYRTNRRTGTTNNAASYGFRILLEFKGLGSVGS